MPLIPPKITRVRAPALGSGEDSATTTRVQDTTGNALDRLLKFINTAFAQVNNALTVLLPVTLSKGVSGNLGVTGALTGAGYSGGPISGTTGTFSGSVSSGIGFHALTGMYSALVAATSSLPTTDTALYYGYIGTTPLGAQVFGYRPVRAGSVTGMSGVTGCGTVAKAFTMTLYKNGTATAYSTVSSPPTNGFIQFAATNAPKGTYAFAAGDLLEVRARANSATVSGGNGEVVVATIEMELGA